MSKRILFLLLLPTPAFGLSPSAAVKEALADADKLAKEDQPFIRYLYSPDVTAGYLKDFQAALRLHVNLISREASLAYPRMVAPGLYTVDIREYGWLRGTFEKLANIDPYFHRRATETITDARKVAVEVEYTAEVEYNFPVEYEEEYEEQVLYTYYSTYYRCWLNSYRTEKRTRKKIRQEKRVRTERRTRTVYKTKKTTRQQTINQLYIPQGAGQLASLALLLDSQQPIARADWFLVQGARQLSLTNRQTGTGYYDWLQLANRDDYFKLIGFDKAAAARTQIRGVIGESKVAAQNRQVLRDGVSNGAHYTTLEVADQSDRGVAINNLRDGELLHVAEEHYAPLLNGLPATFLSNDKGVRQDSVPDAVAGNKSQLNVGNDTRVHVNLSCMQCHEGQVLQPIDEDVRATYTGRLSVLTGEKGVQLELKRQYGADLLRFLQLDRTAYQDTFLRVTGKPAKEAAGLYSRAFTDYAYGRVTLDLAARELGTDGPGLRKALKDAATRLGRGDFRLDPFLLDVPGTIPRLNFEDSFQDAQDILYGVLKQ